MFMLSILMKPKRFFGCSYLLSYDLCVEGDRQTSLAYLVTCLVSKDQSVCDSLTNQERVDAMSAETDSLHVT